MTCALRFPAVFLLLALFAQGQASNIGVSAPAKPSSAASKPAADCRSESHINAKGELEFTDCTGKTEKEDRSKFDAPSTSHATDSPASLDPATRAAQQEALQAKYAYQAFSYAHARRTFDFQYWSGKVIFWVVLLIVFAGLAFSAVQFYVGLRHPLDKRAAKDSAGKADKDDKDAPQPTPDDPCVSEFEASLQGIKLKSSVLGLIILAMSMVFFYLYLKFVYQITNISQ
jgi:hypothetical protein